MKHLKILFALFLITLFYYEWQIQKNDKIIQELIEENEKLRVERIIYNQGDKTNYEL